MNIDEIISQAVENNGIIRYRCYSNKDVEYITDLGYTMIDLPDGRRVIDGFNKEIVLTRPLSTVGEIYMGLFEKTGLKNILIKIANDLLNNVIDNIFEIDFITNNNYYRYLYKEDKWYRLRDNRWGFELTENPLSSITY